MPLSPINEPRDITIDHRDWDAWRNRTLRSEEEIRRLNHELALLQQGIKERFDVISVLLARLESAVARKDVE